MGVKTGKKKSKVELALDRLRKAMVKAKKQGKKIVIERWGVRYNAKTKRWEATEKVKGKDCACAFGSALLVDQPELPKKAKKELAQRIKDNFGEVEEDMLDEGDLVIETVAKHFGLTEKQVEQFITYFDRQEGYIDDERDLPKTERIILRRARKYSDEFAEKDNRYY